MPITTSVKSALRGQVSPGQEITVKGWLRSKRDSKAGISFLAIHDGSCFDAIQAVVPSTLHNYESELLRLSTGCAVVVTGELVPSQGKGQSVEIQAREKATADVARGVRGDDGTRTSADERGGGAG